MRKIAILFGNNEYENKAACLKCAVNDAKELEKKLSELEFETKSVLNAKRNEMAEEISNFATNLLGCDVGLFFFAGHGFQFDGQNYLATSDTSFNDDMSAKYTSFRLNDVIEAMNGSDVLIKILIIDACRSSGVSGSRGMLSGFAPIFAPRGMIIAFATSPGQMAKEGIQHGIFTEAILKHIMTPNITIETMFKRVRNTVYLSSDSTQVTWEHTSLMGDFVFNKGKENTTSNIYHIDAFGDENYECESGSEIYGLICDLKTYNYNYQNLVINKMNKINLMKSDKNDLFVLGRNLYQASINAFNITKFFDSLHSNLNKYGQCVRYHLLNGISYEIYFDSKGCLRKKFKTHKYEEVLAELMSADALESRKFIRTQLEDFEQRVFYIPGREKMKITVMLNELCEKRYNRDTVYFIEGIYMDGQNVLYNEDGTKLYKYEENNYAHEEMNVAEFEGYLREVLVVTKRNIEINYTYNSKLQTEDILIIVPMKQQLLRYAN